VTVSYTIDAFDRVIDHDEGWSEFAEQNDAPELTDFRGDLWSSIADTTTAALWRAVVTHVRETGRAITVRYRCDAPAARRWFDAVVTPLPDGSVQFDAQVVREEPRAPVVDATVPIDPDRFIHMCSWCNRFECSDGAWYEIEEAAERERWLEQRRQPSITHTICAECMSRQLAELADDVQRGRSGRTSAAGGPSRRRRSRC
jgi:hypothetical protein